MFLHSRVFNRGVMFNVIVACSLFILLFVLAGITKVAKSGRKRSDGSPSVSKEEEIRQLIADGYHSKAVKVYADSYGVPVDTAMQAIDRMQDESDNAPVVVSSQREIHEEKGSEASVSIDELKGLDGFDDLYELLPDHCNEKTKERIMIAFHEGRKVRCIQLLSEDLGMSLQEAKDEIDLLLTSQAYTRFLRGEEEAPVSMLPTVFSDAEVVRLIQAKKVIPAIKLIREIRRCGLKEGKEIADAMKESGVCSKVDGRWVPGAHEGADGEAAPGTAQLDDDLLRKLITSGKKIQAIKEYRVKTGASLKDAKEAVDAMERELRI